MLGIRLRYTRLDSTLRADPRDIRRGINSNTIAVLATAGTSESGAVDPIREIADIAKEDGLYFHVDAASGAFIIPFAKELGYDLSEFDFKINNVSSITVDPHKFGLSVIPSGYILFRSDKIRKPIEVESHYVGTSAHTTFTGTRPGAAAASAFAAITCLGRDGFRKIVKSYFEKRDFLISELDKYGISLYAPPDLNIVLIRSRDPLKVFKRLEKRRILVSLSRRYSSIRLVVHNHVEKTHLSDFVREFAAIEPKL
jgi:tyrosine decarboxylase/tyrosine decarboxylase/aspartate 1-decarboxylase